MKTLIVIFTVMALVGCGRAGLISGDGQIPTQTVIKNEPNSNGTINLDGVNFVDAQGGPVNVVINDEGNVIVSGTSANSSQNELANPSIPVSAISDGDLTINPIQQCQNQTQVSFQTCLDATNGGSQK